MSGFTIDVVKKPVLPTLILFCMIFVVTGVSALADGSAQNAGTSGDGLQQAPVNPLFLSYIEEKNTGVNTVSAQETVSGQNLGYVPSPIYRPQVRGIPISLSQEEGSPYTTGTPQSTYTATYDLRTVGKVSPVKDQTFFGTCWAFASYGSLESTLLPVTPTPDFSEKNLANLAGAGFYWAVPDGGGNAWMSLAYLTRWNGPVNETTDPYPSTSVWTNSSTYPPVQHVQNAILFPARTSATDNNNIKSALTNYGAIYSSFYWHNSFYNTSHTTYYHPPDVSDPANGGGHAVTIIGWDDNYAASNFTTMPAGNGAWLVKNSWGTSWGNEGCFYVSYYDKYFGNMGGVGYETALFRGEATSNYNTLYSYDTLGEVGDYYHDTAKTGSYANVFTATSSGNLSAVGFYTTDMNVPCTIKIYKNPTSSAPNTGTLSGQYTTTLANMGYNTVVLPSAEQVPLATGDKFSVIVTVTNPTNNWYIPVEYNYAGYTSGITSTTGQGYALANSTWDDWYTVLPNSHICLKAYTTVSSTAPTITSVSPTTGSTAGGTSVTITGTNLNGATSVTFGGTPNATGAMTVNNATLITVTAPAHAAGTVDITVTSPAGTSAICAADKFTYGGEPTVSTEMGTFRPSTGYWYLDTNGDGKVEKTVKFGKSGDIPVVGDWNNAGHSEIGVFRNSTGYWYLDYNNDGTADISVKFGKSGDIPVVGNWSNAGHTGIGVFRPSTGYWYLNYNFDGTTDKTIKFGLNGDTPVVPATGDWA